MNIIPNTAAAITAATIASSGVILSGGVSICLLHFQQDAQYLQDGE
jgi:hypothetical protein